MVMLKKRHNLKKLRKREMKNQKRNTTNEENNPAIKTEIRSGAHNSNNSYRKNKNTYYRNNYKKNTKSFYRILLKKFY